MEETEKRYTGFREDETTGGLHKHLKLKEGTFLTDAYFDNNGKTHRIIVLQDERPFHLVQSPSISNGHYSSEVLEEITLDKIELPDGFSFAETHLTRYGFLVISDTDEGYIYPNLMFVDLESHNSIIN